MYKQRQQWLFEIPNTPQISQTERAFTVLPYEGKWLFEVLSESVPCEADYNHSDLGNGKKNKGIHQIGRARDNNAAKRKANDKKAIAAEKKNALEQLKLTLVGSKSATKKDVEGKINDVKAKIAESERQEKTASPERRKVMAKYRFDILEKQELKNLENLYAKM